ncbi:MAG TPA: alpha-amylase family glycosyl hydrolase [Ilumatobacteraceae bacterium]|nr:alpha-amylase family glycosyl hydrolase [Ilumatobacteraceae bacterium]
MEPLRTVRIHAPAAREVTVSGTIAIRHDDGAWVAEFAAAVGDHYWINVDGGPPLLDPSCLDMEMTPSGPRSVVRDPWPPRSQGAPLTNDPVVYELHVRGFGRTFLGCIDRLDHVAGLGVNVIELMPVHPFDTADNYWGYMPLVWGAVHRPYAHNPARAAEELAELVAAAHDRGMHVWLDVVFNHTGEGDAAMPTFSFRGLDDAHAYRHQTNGEYTNDSGCGNDIDPADPNVRALVLSALDRFADLGIDGFRFDLASLLTRDGGELVALISTWAAARGVALIAEPWDMASYQVGSPVWPDDWLQWNDRFRDDVRGFLRGEPGLVGAVRQRVQGSPGLFAQSDAARSVNFLTAHDGLTMNDLTLVTSDHHHSWDTGPDLRVQQLKNYFTMLLLAAGTPMWVMGDEFARTQHGDPNPYNVDSELTWVDWSLADAQPELTKFVGALVALRRAHPPQDFEFFGVGVQVDERPESRSIAWCANGLYVMVNAWWEPLVFEVQVPGEWQSALSTAGSAEQVGATVTVPARSITVLRQR